jgi:hypothetical protein
MKAKRLGAMLVCAIFIAPVKALSAPVTTAFTYQGQLKEAGVPANGFYDFMFSLYDVPLGGTPIPFDASSSIVLLHQEVENGLFTVALDFGVDVFQKHDELWLEIGVRHGTVFLFTTLSPRQRIDSAPRAIVAKYAEATKGGSLAFGDMGLTSLGVDPALPGLTAMDPVGMRVMSITRSGRCHISGEPCALNQRCPLDETCDPCETCAPLPTKEGSLFFGLRNSSIGVKKGLSGLTISDVGGVRLLAGVRVCTEEYPPYGEVKYCEADAECYGCCTTMKRCSSSGTLCESDADCQIGNCNNTGNDCHTDWDCNPGRCQYSLAPCYIDGVCMGAPSDYCGNPPPEGCSGGETCEEDWPCTRHCQSDADCPDEGSFCDSPVLGDCVTPEGRCSGNGLACYADSDCPAGHCAESTWRECWSDDDCLICGWGCSDLGPCVGAQSCRQPIQGLAGRALAVHFGESDDHAFGFDPGLRRLVAVDPQGLSLVSQGHTCSGTGESCESDADCPHGGCSGIGLPCRIDAMCPPPSICNNPPPQTCESDANGLRVFFGSDGDTSIGTEPALGGLVLRSPDGARLMAASGSAAPSARLFFGAGDGPYIGNEPTAGGLVIGAPGGARMFNPQPEPPRDLRLAFGLTDETSIGTSPDAAGLILSDPTGVRLLNPMNPGENALIFGLGGARGIPESRIDTGMASDGMRFYASSFFFDGGPVGIGTSAPSATLEVANSGGQQAIYAHTNYIAVRGVKTGNGTFPGVQGETESASAGASAVRGTLSPSTPGDNAAGVYGLVTSTGSAGAGVRAYHSGSGKGLLAEVANSNGYAGYFLGGRNYFGGGVGIGTTDPTAKLEVEGGSPLGGPAVAAFDRTGSDGVILDFQRDGTSVGSVTVSRGFVSYNAFTGSHLASSDAKLGRGDLVRLTGVNSYLHDNPESEMIYGIAPSTQANDPRCLGAYLGEHRVGQSDNRRDIHLVMAVGNGEMWVVDTGEDVQPSDYLISSDVSGCAMQDDPQRFPVGYIVARAAEGVQWAGIDPDEHGVRKARVSVFFGSFVRGADPLRLTAEVARLTGVVESQRQAIEMLEERLSSLQRMMEHPSRVEGAQKSASSSVDSDLGSRR